jgi:hypothetical protein
MDISLCFIMLLLLLLLLLLPLQQESTRANIHTNSGLFVLLPTGIEL